MTSYTTNLRLNVPVFDQIPWDTEVNTNWTILDATVGMLITVPNLAGVWTNSHAYLVGQTVIDSADSSMWFCLVAHTSSSAPTTFSTERAFNPTLWTQSSGSAQFYAQQAASSATAAQNAANDAAAAAASIGDVVHKHGDTMTGQLVLFGDPTVPLGAATKQFVESLTGGDGSGFLPLAGGTMQGSLRGRPPYSSSGAFQGYTIFSSAISGTTDLTHDWYLSLIETTSDTLNTSGRGLVGQYIHMTSGGPGTTGNRVGQYIDTYHVGSTLDRGQGWPGQFAGQWVYAHASGNEGGTSTSSPWGSLWGGLSSATLQAGATFWSACVGHEINVGVSTGASASYVQALKVVLQNHNQASNANDYLFGLAKVALSDQGLQNGIVFGSVDGYWPITSNGTLIGAQQSIRATPPAMTASYGIDFSNVTFSSAAFRSNGILIDNAGHTSWNFGVSFVGGDAGATGDVSKHIRLAPDGSGINYQSNQVNILTTGSVQFHVSGTRQGYVDGTGINGPLGQGARYPGLFTTLGCTGLFQGIAGLVSNVPNTSTPLLQNEYLGANVGGITTDGVHSNYGVGSDYRLKTVTGPSDGSRIDALVPYEGYYNATPDKPQAMLLAHEVATVIPHAVWGEKDAVDADGKPIYQLLDYSKLIADLVAKCQTLERRLAALEGVV